MDSKELEKRNRADVEWVVSTVQGRRFMWRLMGYCGVHRDIGGPADSVYKELGKRNVGLYLEGLIADASEDRLFEMMREAKNRTLEEQIHEHNTGSDNADNTRSINTVDGLISTEHSVLGPGYATNPGPVF